MEISIKWNVCRVCLQEQPPSKFQRCNASAQSEQVPIDEKLAKQIYECSGVMVKVGDMLPDKICRKCLNKLKYAVNFRTMCHKSNDYLQTVVEKAQSATSMHKLDKHRVDTQDLESLGDISDNDSIFDSSSPFLSDVGGGDVVRQIVMHSRVNDSGKRNRSELIAEGHYDHDEESEVEQQPHAKIKLEDRVKPTVHSLDRNSKIQLPLKKEMQEEIDENLITIFINEDEHETEEIEAQQDGGRKRLRTNSDSELSTDHEYIVDDADIPFAGTLSNVDCVSYVVSKKRTVVSSAIDDDNEKDGDRIPDDVLSEDVISTTSIATLGEEDKALVQRAANVSRMEMIDNDHEGSNSYIVSSKTGIKREDDMSMASPSAGNDDDVEYETEFVSMENVEYLIDDSNDGMPTSSAPLSATGTPQPNATKTVKSPRQKSKATKASRLTVRGKEVDMLKVFICDVCGNHFTNRNVMNYHMRIHRNDKPHECEICSKRFNTACNLTAHMRIHTGERPFECQFCARRFRDRSTHIKHERVHTNEKPFVCGVCGNAFSLSTTLRAHEKTHSNERAYKCEPCDKSFKLPHQLKAHLNTYFHKARIDGRI